MPASDATAEFVAIVWATVPDPAGSRLLGRLGVAGGAHRRSVTVYADHTEPMATSPATDRLEGANSTVMMPPHLFLVVGRWGGTVVVTARGELDAMNSERFLELVIDLVDGQGNLDVVLDLGGLRRGDPCGLDLLRDAVGRAERRGGQPRLGRPGGAVFKAILAADLAPFIISAHDPASGYAPR